MSKCDGKCSRCGAAVLGAGDGCPSCLLQLGLESGDPPPELPAGTIIGRYEILELLGRGGMGEVYLALDRRLQRRIALKILSQDFADQPRWRARFEQEARSVAAINHPNICTIHEIVEDQGWIGIAMEHVEGAPLSAPSPSPQEAAAQVAAILAGLETAHCKGIIHRDLKLSNVMLTLDRQVKILDFGLARMLASSPLASQEAPVRMTHAGEILGSPPYMSPEMLKGEEPGPQSDLFSTGVILYELLTGRLPFSGATLAETAGAILKDPPTAFDPAEVPPALSKIALRALEKDPEERYSTAAEMRAALEGALADLEERRESLSRSFGSGARGSNWLRWGIPLAGLALLATALLWDRPAGPDDPQVSPAVLLSSDQLLLERGRILALEFSADENLQALRLLREFLRRNPDSAQAHSLLALTTLKRFWWYQSEAGLLLEARNSADQALLFQPELEQAQVVRAIAETLTGPAPEAYLRLSQSLRTESPPLESMAWLAYNFYAKAGLFDAAERLLRRLEGAPPNPYADMIGAFLLIQKGEIPIAHQRLKRLQLGFADSDAAAYLQSLAGVRAGNLPMLEDAVLQYEMISPDKPSLLVFRAYIEVSRGGAPVLPPEDVPNSDYETAALYAQVLARQGRQDSALEWLDRALSRGSYNLVQLGHPDFDPLRRHPRFVALRESLKSRIEELDRALRF